MGHVLLFQDRSLRPEEIEGETWPFRGKGLSAIQEGEGREAGGREVETPWPPGPGPCHRARNPLCSQALEEGTS